MTTRWEIRVDEANTEAEIPLTENGRIVLERRYLRKGPDGRPVETIPEMFRRVARAIAEAEKELGGDPALWEERFYRMLTSLRFLPNSPTFTGAGTPLGQLAACFTPEMRVMTDRGPKRIDDLRPGDRVLTHRGRYQPVRQTSRRFYRGPLKVIQVGRIGQPIRATPEHPFLTPQGWVMAADLRPGDWVAVGFPKGILPVGPFDPAEAVYAEDLEAQCIAPAIRVRRRSRPLIEEAFEIHLSVPVSLGNDILRNGDHAYLKIEHVGTEGYEGFVYNCEVEEDHTYVVEGVVVHNCFVLPLEDDMGKIPGGIFQTLRDAALIQQTGGGNGFSFSRLRPKNAIVFSSMGRATGPVGFLRVYDRAFGEIAQGGCLTPDTLVFTTHGLLRLDEIVDPEKPGWQPQRITVWTDEGPRISLHGYNRGRSRVLRVVTEEGLTLTGTPDHKVKVLTREGWVWRRLDELQPGEAIPVILGQHQGHLQPLKPVEKEHGDPVMPRLPPVLDEEFAFFLGYLTGDGFVAHGENDHRIGVAVADHSYLIEEMPRLMERLFGVQVHIQRKPGKGSTLFIIDNRAVKEFLRMNGLGKGRSVEASVPRLIRLSPPSVVAAYLRGLFEADGRVVHGYPMLCTASERLAREVAVLLIGLGCPVKVRSGHPSRNRFGRSRPWFVRIVSSAGLRAWAERIGCDPRSRFRVCLERIPDSNRESAYPLPEPAYWLSPVRGATALPLRDRRGRGTGRKIRSPRPALPRALRRYVRGEGWLTLTAYEGLTARSPEFARHALPVGNRWFVHVRSVEPAGEALTLDLEVSDNHTYLANGMVTHNSRRGANMAVLRVDHPDVEEFITCKTDENAITNFNISVGITDAFMRAVENDEEWELRFPDVLHPAYRNFRGTLEDAERAGIPIRVYKRVRARDLFRKIAAQAHHNGEPGVLFLDTANRSNPVPHLYTLEATNPCGEQWLGPYENCCLGSVNLARHVKYVDGRAEVDWEKLRETVEWATRFLDNVVQVNQYVPAVPQLKEAAFQTRRIGLGFMGLADLMYHLRIRYGSEEGQEFAAQIAEFIRYHAMRTSIELAKERGPFPAIRGSIYDPENLKWEPPKPLKPYTRDWGRPPLDWKAIVEGIRRYGIRNAAQTTVAPTGTLSTVAGCEGYGCEPVFALAYIRYVHEAEGRLELRYVSPLFMRALKEAGLNEEARARIIEEVLRRGTCQHIQELPDWIRHTFVVAQDLTPEEHVWMQASIQAFIDNSISKTINFPETATVEDVEKAYLLAWKLGCKGLTVYVAGSRQKEVLETLETKAKKEQKGAAMVPTQPTLPQPVGPTVRPRPQKLAGVTYRIATPVGTAFITLNENGEGQPFEVFLNVGKAGSDIAAVAEAIGRLISLLLRLPSPVPPAERLRQVVDQLQGIGGGRALGFGPERVRSLPDGIARVLAEYLAERGLEASAIPSPPPALPLPEPRPEPAEREALGPVGDLCPQCGEATLLEQEGCRTCYNCGYSEC
ncbi:adenosylcobalamin-dependent ribonucleoside-diphosphate reductase [Thermoflexus sp.]|uniref:adenosylcobalamin-dependent ribonucleoside-diphosphate reductase n=1 Tax=Thermoflexus sp. TaxID=1969742 RepID=UPI0035E436F3